jgi:hypothetical protein
MISKEMIEDLFELIEAARELEAEGYDLGLRAYDGMDSGAVDGP